MHTIWIMNHHAGFKGRHVFFAEELAKRGYKVLLFSSSYFHNRFIETKSYPGKKFYIKEDCQTNFQRVWIKTPPYYRNDSKRLKNQIVFAYRAVKAGLKIHDSEPDIVIGSSVHLFTVLAAYYIARTKGTPFIFEVRDLWPQTLIDMGVLKEKRPATLLLKLLEKYLYKKADHIISLLPRGSDYITNLGINKNKISYIPNGVDLTWFDKQKEIKEVGPEIQSFFDLHVNKIKFVYCGAMGIANGLDTIIEAAEFVRRNKSDLASKIHFLLVGGGPEKEKLIGLAEKFGLKNITFLGPVSKEEIPFILSNCDVTIFHLKKTPVFQYGISSNKIFEYMASGKPMISAVESCFDFALEAQCGIAVPPENPQKMSEAILEIAAKTDTEKRVMGENGRKYVEENHDYTVLTDRLLKVINLCISNRKGTVE